MIKSLQASAIPVKLNGLDAVRGAVYQITSKPLEGKEFDKLIEFPTG